MKIILITISILATIEIGLQSKNRLEKYLHSNQYRLKHSDSFNILIIGDSVSDSYKKKLEVKLSTIYPTRKIRINDHILPSVKLVEIVSNINDILKKNNPNIVITMLGKGDIAESKNHSLKAKEAENLYIYEHLILYKIAKSFIKNINTREKNETKSDEISDNEKSLFEEVKDLRGRELLLAKKYDEAISYFKIKILNHPNSFESHSVLGEIYLNKREFNKAIIHLEKLIEIDPQDAASYGALSYAYRSLQQYKRAEELLFNAYQRFPSSPNLIKQIIEHNMTLGDFENFYKFTQKLKEIKGNIADVYNYEGLYHFNKKEFHKAITSFKKALNANHSNQEFVTLNLAHAYFGAGNKVQAIAKYKQALILDPYDKNKHFNYLMRSIHYGEFQQAKEFYLDHLLKDHPDEVRFYVPVSRVFLEAKEFKKSYHYLSIYLKKYPTDKEALKTLATLKAETNNLRDIGIKSETINFLNKNSFTKDYYSFYPRLSRLIIQFGAKHIILQYPDHSISELENIKFESHKNLILLDNYNYFIKNHPKDKITDLFVWDNIHLSEKGNNLLIKHIVEKIKHHNFIE